MCSLAIITDEIVPTFMEYHRSFPNPRLFACIVDNFTHGFIATFVWMCTYVYLNKRCPKTEMVGSFFCGCAVDLDHFVEAGSFSLKRAVNLTSRPLGHSVLFLLLGSILSWLISGSTKVGVLTLSSISTHHIRDARRRGLYFWPFGGSPAFPYSVYLTIICLWPFVNYILISSLPNNTKHSKDPKENKELFEQPFSVWVRLGVSTSHVKFWFPWQAILK